MDRNRVLVVQYDSRTNLGDLFFKNFPDLMNRIRKGDTVLLKPNMFTTVQNFYTNPELLIKSAKVFKETGARVIIAERLRAIAEVFKDYHEIYKYAEVVSFDDLPARKYKIQGATSLRQEIEIPELIFECDYLIGVPQFRTHAGLLMSNALKNMVGILPGFTTRMVHNVGLTEAVVDLNRIRRQDLVISDLTVTIEGNYPIEGVPVRRDLMIIGDNALAADWVAVDLAGFETDNLQYLSLAGKAGLGPHGIAEVEIINDYQHFKFEAMKSGVNPTRRFSKMTCEYDSACPECKRYCHSLIDLFDSHGLPDMELAILSGPNPQGKTSGPDTGVGAPRILIGNCTYPIRESGVYVEGCPPRAIQGFAVLEWLQNKGRVRENYQNQCRW